MQVTISPTKKEMGERAAAQGAGLIRRALDERGEASVIVATGASQFEMFEALIAEEVDWGRVTFFHLDEYIGMADSHPASFRRYLKERFADKLPTAPRAFHYIDAETDAPAACARAGALISAAPVDVAFVGIGENCHLAFNDPPADFDTEEPYLVVDLDEACRRQQLGEGWFPTFEDVPTQAVSMSIRQIMKSKSILCTVPDQRKADAAQKAIEGPVTPDAPASILQRHADCVFFLDAESASRLTRPPVG